MEGLFLGIDCGTQGTKALVLDAGSGRVLGLGSAAHAPARGRDGRREQDPSDWLAALHTAVAGALHGAGVNGQAIRALAVSGQQHGLVMLDAQGQVLRPAKLWCDTETTAENQKLLNLLGGPQGSIERLGLVIAPGYTVSKLLWSKRSFPDLFARLAHVLLPHDYLNYWLTGRACSEPGDASGTGYYNVHHNTWATDVLQHIEPGERLLAALPELLAPGDCIGPLREQAASRPGAEPSRLGGHRRRRQHAQRHRYRQYQPWHDYPQPGHLGYPGSLRRPCPVQPQGRGGELLRLQRWLVALGLHDEPDQRLRAGT